MANYKPTFGIKSVRRPKRSNTGEKGDQGIGFKLTHDNNYDMDNKRLANVQKPTDSNDAVNKDYFENTLSGLSERFHIKNKDIDMNNKAIKNLSWPYDNDDAVPKKYLYQYGLLLDLKLNGFNAKDKKIVNVSDPQDPYDVANMKYIDVKIEESKAYVDNKFLRVTEPVDDNDIISKGYLRKILNPNLSLPKEVSPSLLKLEMNLKLYNTLDPREFILKGIVKIKQNITTKANWIANIPLDDNPMSEILFSAIHKEDHKTYYFLIINPNDVIRNCIIDQDKRLIVYGELKGGSTLYFNSVITP